MANLQETLKTYNEKKAAMDEQLAAKRQEIESLMADIEALPSELEGQSTEYINRQKQKLMKRVESKTESLRKWTEEQTKKIEDWLEVQKKKIQDGLDKMMELEGQVIQSIATLQTQATLAILTGQKAEEQETEEPETEQPVTLPTLKEKFDDDEYLYSYKNSKGVLVGCLGTEAAKRKRYNSNDIYTDSSEDLRKANIFRKKYKWSFKWDHVIKEYKEVSYGTWDMVPTTNVHGISSAEEPLENIDDVFTWVDKHFIIYKDDAKKFFKQSSKHNFFKKSITNRSGDTSEIEIWNIEIKRTT